MLKKYIAVGSILMILMASCRDTGSVHSEDGAPVANLVRVIDEYHSLDSAARMDTLSLYRPEITALMKTLSEDSLSDNMVDAWSSSLAVEKFTPVVDSIFPSIEPLSGALGNILKRSEENNLELPHRKYAAVVYGRPESILFVDSVMLIALNHFLGADFEGYSHWPVYRRLDKTPENLPYSIAEALVGTSYPYRASGADATLLSRMLYEGALATAKMKLVKDAKLSAVLGYNARDMEWLEKNESEIWRELVSKKLLYDNSELTADRFIAPAPAIRDMGTQWPGRVGRFIGYRIVQAYLTRHPETKLNELLSPTFYTSSMTLPDSGY